MPAWEHLSKRQFFHGSWDDTFEPGDMIHTPYARALLQGGRPSSYQMNPLIDQLDPERERAHRTYMTNDPKSAGSWGGTVYKVEPVNTEKIWQDDYGSRNKDWQVHGPLRVLGKYEGRQDL